MEKSFIEEFAKDFSKSVSQIYGLIIMSIVCITLLCSSICCFCYYKNNGIVKGPQYIKSSYRERVMRVPEHGEKVLKLYIDYKVKNQETGFCYTDTYKEIYLDSFGSIKEPYRKHYEIFQQGYVPIEEPCCQCLCVFFLVAFLVFWVGTASVIEAPLLIGFIVFLACFIEETLGNQKGRIKKFFT